MVGQGGNAFSSLMIFSCIGKGVILAETSLASLALQSFFAWGGGRYKLDC